MRTLSKLKHPAILSILIGLQTSCFPLSADDCKGATTPSCETRSSTLMQGKVVLGDGSEAGLQGVKVTLKGSKYDGQCGTGGCEKIDSAFTDTAGNFQANKMAVEYATYEITLEKEGYKAASVYQGSADEIFSNLKCQMLVD